MTLYAFLNCSLMSVCQLLMSRECRSLFLQRSIIGQGVQIQFQIFNQVPVKLRSHTVHSTGRFYKYADLIPKNTISMDEVGNGRSVDLHEPRFQPFILLYRACGKKAGRIFHRVLESEVSRHSSAPCARNLHHRVATAIAVSPLRHSKLAKSLCSCPLLMHYRQTPPEQVQSF